MDLPLIASDCDDSNKALNPGVLEQCNGIDDNCDGVTDQPGITGCHTYYQDKDGDGCAGAPAGSKCLCNGEGDFTATEQCDCNDTDPMVNTRMPEICGNGKDDNCMLGEQDENALGCLMYYRDNDGDGYGVLPGKCFCSFVSPYSVTKPGDCNDSNKNVYPGHGC
jgi:hypothetical protein